QAAVFCPICVWPTPGGAPGALIPPYDKKNQSIPFAGPRHERSAVETRENARRANDTERVLSLAGIAHGQHLRRLWRAASLLHHRVRRILVRAVGFCRCRRREGQLTLSGRRRQD